MMTLSAATDEGTGMEFFEELVASTAGERSELYAVPQIQDALSGAITREMYVDFLTQAYHHVRHTVPLLTLAHHTLKPSQASFGPAFEDYVREEIGHDQWILEDIRNCGRDPDLVSSGRPRFATELMIAYAYDFVSRINPLGFFGMVFVLEGTSAALALKGANAILQSLKLPPECFSYLTSHGTLDQEHMEFFRGLMTKVDASEDRASIIHMAKAMFVLYANVFRSIPRPQGSQDGL
jgi:hypothetical protein